MIKYDMMYQLTKLYVDSPVCLYSPSLLHLCTGTAFCYYSTEQIWMSCVMKSIRSIAVIDGGTIPSQLPLIKMAVKKCKLHHNIHDYGLFSDLTILGISMDEMKIANNVCKAKFFPGK